MGITRSRVKSILAIILIAGAAYLLGTSFSIVPHSASAAPVLYNQDTITAIYDQASPAVVEIDITQQGASLFGRSSVQEGQGSGFLIDTEGHILTNNHVVQGATNVQVVVRNGTTVDAKVVGTDPVDDLAIVSVDPSTMAGVTPLAFGDSSAVRPGQMAVALGNPYGLTDTITVGIISGLNRSLGGNSSLRGMIQTDAAINPGNSGGPLLDAQGQVIGINTAIEAANGARGIGFAVPSGVATRVIPSLLSGKQVTRPWIGISGSGLNSTRAKTYGLSTTSGIYVVTVTDNSPASKAGLKAAGTDASGAPGTGGDVITAVDGKAVTGVDELSNYIATKQVGDSISLSVIRDGQTLTVQLTLEPWPARPPATSASPRLNPFAP